MDWKLTDEQLLSIVNDEIDEAVKYFDEEIRPKLEEHYKKYKADKAFYDVLMSELSKKSKFISADIADAIEGALPALMKIFYGTDDVISISGHTGDDAKRANTMQELCNFQITTQNDGFMLFYRWIKDALITALGVVKAHWKREYEHTEFKTTVGIEQLALFDSDPNIEINSVEQTEGGFNDIGVAVPLFNIAYTQTKVKENRPVLENMDAARLLYDPLCTSLEDAQYVIDRKYVTIDELRRKEKDGIYENIDGAIETSAESIETMRAIIEDRDDSYSSGSSLNRARDRIVLYEYYGKIDVNQDELLEDVIITVVGKTIISKQENIYGMFPFMALSPILEPFTLHGKSFADLIGQLQDLKTALIKEIMVNIAQSNDGREFIDPAAVNLEDLVRNKKYIRVNANGGSIQNHVQPKAFSPMHPMTMQVLEYIDGIKENRTGITRYNQGLDANSLNHTAHGIQTIMNAANQRLELIARIMSETGIKRLFRFLVSANQRFIDQNTVIRLTNDYIEITPDDLAGDFDMTVSSGTGVSDKQMDNQNLNEVMQIQASLIKGGFIPQQIAYDFIYNATKKKLEVMGYKNVNDFIPSPDMLKQVQQAAAMQGDMQNGQQIFGSPQTAFDGAVNNGGYGGQGSAVHEGVNRQMPQSPVSAMANGAV